MLIQPVGFGTHRKPKAIVHLAHGVDPFARAFETLLALDHAAESIPIQRTAGTREVQTQTIRMNDELSLGGHTWQVHRVGPRQQPGMIRQNVGGYHRFWLTCEVNGTPWTIGYTTDPERGRLYTIALEPESPYQEIPDRANGGTLSQEDVAKQSIVNPTKDLLWRIHQKLPSMWPAFSA